MKTYLVTAVRAGKVTRYRRVGPAAWLTARRLRAMGWTVSVVVAAAESS